MSTKKSKYLSFADAKKYIQKLGLKNYEDFRNWTSSNQRPTSIPYHPHRTYKEEWKGIGDFLGTGSVASFNRKFKSYDEHKKYANRHKIINRAHWYKHFKEVIKPNNLPYRSDPWKSLANWVSHEDFFGKYYSPNSKPGRYLNLNEHKKYCKENDLLNKNDWIKHYYDSIKPNGLAYAQKPWNTFKDKWISDEDFFGKRFIKGKQASIRKRKVSYEEAVAYFKPFQFKTRKELLSYTKQNKEKLPEGIYADPLYQFPDKYNIYDFITASDKNNFYTKNEAIEVISKLNFKTRKAFDLFNKSKDRDIRMPKDPYNYYGIKGSELLSIKIVANQDIVWREFKLAREFVRSKRFKNQSEFYKFTKTTDFPNDIPKNPDRVKQYESEWIDWNDWLGLEKKEYLPFELARDKARFLARTKGINTQEKWNIFTKTPEFPNDLPVNPRGKYDEFSTMSDWLGIINKWDKPVLIAFIKSLLPIIDSLDPSELHSIVKANNLLSALNYLDSNSPIKQTLDFLFSNQKDEAKELINSINDESDLKDIDGEIIISDENENELSTMKSIEEIETDIDNEEEDGRLPEIKTKEILNNLDHIEGVMNISDEETVEFLINKAVGRIWSYFLRTDQNIDNAVNKIRGHIGLDYSRKVKDRFLSQFDGASNLQLPNGYDFKINGDYVEPNLMQKLIVYRLATDKRIGNWSGTGAGKTLGAILAAEYIQSKLTIIIGLNNTILSETTGWAGEIKAAFPSSHVHIKERKNFKFKPSQSDYLLLNYESFQLAESKQFIDKILDNHKVDLVVLDEIHSAKTRDKVLSKRRQLINYLLTEGEKRNPDLHILGMSATPVVNSLDEAVSLIEMIKGRAYKELDTSSKISSALAIHEQLVINGIRYMPNYKMKLIEKEIEIEDGSIIQDLQNVGRGKVLEMEQVLLNSKVDTIKKLLKPGTVIFSYYVEKIFPKLKKISESAGYKVTTFNGESKAGVDEFIKGKADILIGSAALGTGVNGLQYVCNRMIMITLPWTSSGYEQLVGRIYRQGSKFEQIEIFIPQVVLDHKGSRWSWDEQRMKRIKFKKTLADAAVDGVIPEANLIDQRKMLEDAKSALNKWVERIEGGEVMSITRPILEIPLPPDVYKKNVMKYGDFSLMNQKINTSNSSTTHERFQKDPEEFYQYHSEYRKAREDWNEIPFEVFSERIKKASDQLVVGDFGCGEAILSKIVRNKVYSFDHVAVDDTVITCDMAHIELPDGILNICVFSLSLMGLNWKDYLVEAHRLSAPGAQLMIAEPQNRWADDKLNTLVNGIKEVGFDLLGEPEIRDKFLYINASKKI